MRHEPRIDTLIVPGARLHHEVRGSGPVLLIIPTGNGDAEPFAPLADALADRYTVITYDRRGFSRSPMLRPVDDERRLTEDVDDARRLLVHVADGPAHVLGSSSGAVIALALLERHPDRLRTLIAHEPPLASVLPDSAHWLGFYADLYTTFRQSGVEAARKMFREGMGMTTPTRAPEGSALPPDRLAEMLTRLRRNQLFWFEHEIRTYPAFLPDIEALRTFSDRLILAGGTTAREHFPYLPNVELAGRLGTEIMHFPGGHVGYVTHPDEFAAMLGSVLDARTG
ncbi:MULTISPECIES: alpha/beta fold hydrolase [Actinoalloteichus]|uniref:Hydrolase or acyltransferase of alpha/beta superfamily n=1 Tax=Actinoalloteichus fjordicus TaxID=1612552 RepID=A0AAC9PSW9_9PSEU|nr:MULTISPECIES: alpha/beta fold hydrolase [Actinoalloteichus]APU15533.1 putative hydrolase or acyltransferase of alpha/beta superfamily [Actinoalloteichus fjordicus]APU21600.1 putative hydrolase or acyltransferase of alpha/beta superfamily [Actinoalloteichus sp. GBA129-24]